MARVIQTRNGTAPVPYENPVLLVLVQNLGSVCLKSEGPFLYSTVRFGSSAPYVCVSRIEAIALWKTIDIRYRTIAARRSAATLTSKWVASPNWLGGWQVLQKNRETKAVIPAKRSASRNPVFTRRVGTSECGSRPLDDDLSSVRAAAGRSLSPPSVGRASARPKQAHNQAPPRDWLAFLCP